jgi:hypothetical protein
MRLKPPVSYDEALDWLVLQAKWTWGSEDTPELRESLAGMAKTMVAISTAEVPEDAEPLLI